MFIAHFENGESVSEEKVSWDALPGKEKITSLQLVHTPFDLFFTIRRGLEKVLEVCSSDLADRVRGVRQLLLDTLRLSAEALEKKKNLIEELKLGHVLNEWTAELKRLAVELEETRKLPGFEDDARRLDEQIRRLKYYVHVANQIRRDRLFLRDLDQRCVTLSGSSEHRYFFFQFKEAEVRVRVGGGEEVENVPKSQTIGMVVSPQGHCVCATMNLWNGWTRVYYTTIQSLRLNLECYPYIKLEEVR